jgi:hypothetical protein
MMDSTLVRVVIVSGAWRLRLHRPAWLRCRVHLLVIYKYNIKKFTVQKLKKDGMLLPIKKDK